jgi:superfamily II DNA or RNA helicase
MSLTYHHFYFGGTESDYIRGAAKGGETGDPYRRLHQYGTAAQGDNRFRFFFVVSVPITDMKVIASIEKSMLEKFERIEAPEEDEENLNRASTIEGVRFSNAQDFKEAFDSSIKELGLDSLRVRYYTTDQEIQAILKEYRAMHVKPAPLKSYSGITLRLYQNEDIQNTIHAFLEEGVVRGFWSIECGLGKTVMAFELMMRMKKRRNIFVVPRITLLIQGLRDFLKWKYPANNLFVCGGSSLPSDISHLIKVRNYRQLPEDSQYICVVTYDSLPNFIGGSVDLIIFDEAHHLVPSGKKADLSGNLFGLSDTNINSKYRLAITGTPKDTPLVNTEDGSIEHIGMSHQPELYGTCLAERNYMFGRENGFLSPFDVVCLKTTPVQMRAVIENLRKHLHLPKASFQDFLEQLEEWEQGRSRYLTDAIEKKIIESEDSENDIIPGDLILWYAVVADMLIQSISKYGCRRIVTYHTTTRRAELFKRVFALVWNLRNIPTDYMCETVHSKNKNEVNELVKNRFKSLEGPNVRILCNIRTLVEGFDEPSIDTTVFVDNKWSAIEAKQIVGRGNRRDPKNTLKNHRVLIPFLAYEVEEGEDKIVIRTSNDYKTVRYTIKNIILSADPNQSISQTVWLPRKIPRVDEHGKEIEDEEDELDETEKVWIPETVPELHDEELLGSCPTKDMAEQSFYKARLFIHELARKLKWDRFTTESQIVRAWNQFRETHLLPKGIPHDPSKVYRQVGWINWRDYTGLLVRREEFQELHAGEFLEMIRCGEINVFDNTLSSLRTLVENKITRRFPLNPKRKWKISVYDLAELAISGSSKGVKSWGVYPDSLYCLLTRESVQDAIDFERLWPSLHAKYPDLPGIPQEVYDDTFWANYEP